MRTGKQAWEDLASFAVAEAAALDAAHEDELRHALNYGANQGNDVRSSRLRAEVRRALRRRGLTVPHHLEER